MCVCICVFVFFSLCHHLSLFIPLCLFCLCPSLAHTQNAKSPRYPKLCWFLGSATTSRDYAPDPSRTGLPPHTVLGGANGKGPVVAEMTHPCLSSSWVSGPQEHRPPFPGGFRMDLCHPGKHLGRPVSFLFCRMGIMVPASQESVCK